MNNYIIKEIDYNTTHYFVMTVYIIAWLKHAFLVLVFSLIIFTNTNAKKLYDDEKEN
jgi:hypothetical protein